MSGWYHDAIQSTQAEQVFATMNLDNEMHLTPFEWSMLDEVAKAPMTIIARMEVTGTVQTQQLGQAILDTVVEEPLLQSHVVVGETHLDSFWIPAENLLPKIEWKLDQGDGSTEQFQAFDLTREIGFRFVGHIEPGKSQLRFLFHHACCDGLGSMGFIDRVLCRYQNATNENSDEKQNAHIKIEYPNRLLLAKRDPKPQTPMPWHRRWWRSTYVLPTRIAGAAFRKPVQISSSLQATETAGTQTAGIDADRQLPLSLSLTLEPSAKNQLANVAKSRSASMHVLLMRHLIQAVQQWNSQSESMQGSTIRLLVPFSLRTSDHHGMPAANCVSVAFISASKDETGVVDQLSESLSRQMKFIRNWQIDYSWSQSIRLLASQRLLRPLLNRLASQQSVTTVFSNLGQVFRGSELPRRNGKLVAGEFVIDSFHIAAPCTPATYATFAVNFYGEHITLDMNFLPNKINPADAKSLLSKWHQALLATANDA